MAALDIDATLRSLTIDEKVTLLAGADTWTTSPIERLSIPAIKTSDGPHGLRGSTFFNAQPAMLLPSATAMGATFDADLMHRVGEMLAQEAKERDVHLILGPTVCLQRSPLLGRGFEAFAEDPWLSGSMASAYISGAQENGVGCCIKHFAAHDQSTESTEDDVRASERTLREVHLLPFQIAERNSKPWAVMTAYNKINGVHASENSWLLTQVLRDEWRSNSLTISDWFGTYSTSCALNAGLDLEMPGPSRWRGDLLRWAILSKKVSKRKLDASVRRVLGQVRQVLQSAEAGSGSDRGDRAEKDELCLEVASDAIVLLKNDQRVLPLDPTRDCTYALIGPGVLYPAISGGGSADLTPYHISFPYDAFAAVVGAERVQTAIGCRGHFYTPLLTTGVSIPGKSLPGYTVEWYATDPLETPSPAPIASTTTAQPSMYFADNLPKTVPQRYWVLARTTYVADRTCTLELGLCVIGRGRLFVDGKELIDLYSDQPVKTQQTPFFNQASMEVVASLEVVQGQQYALKVYLQSDGAVAGAAALNCGGLRVGAMEKIDPVAALHDAVQLARSVDFPIVIAGLNSDYEAEAFDRTTLALPPEVDELISCVIDANPNTIIVTQSGTPIQMLPWIKKAPAALHAWFGGQETGAAIASVLFGKTNPSGRLSMTFPQRLEDTPAFLSFGKGNKELHYGEGVFLGYRYYEKLQNPPLFWFGYGLSYTVFEYLHLNVQPPVIQTLDRDGTFDVVVRLRNTGVYPGKEVVQVYVKDVKASVPRPVKELKGFKKVWIEPGKTAAVRITLDRYALSFWSDVEESWVAEHGIFQIIVATSADPADHVLQGTLELKESLVWSGL